MTNLKERIKEIIHSNFYVNEDGGIEMYLDYRDELSDNHLYDIMIADDPRENFNELIGEWEFDAMCSHYDSELYNTIKSELTEEETELYNENEDEIKYWIQDNFYFYYDKNHFNKEVKVNLMLDTGNLNYDFTCDNVLNYYGRTYYGNKGEIDKYSSVLWVARQMKKVEKLRKACKEQYRDDGNYVDREKESDKFIESVIQELENLTCHMGTMTFLLTMDLFEYFDLREAMAKELKKYPYQYTYEDRNGDGYITVSKDTMCGLFNPWQGGGSVLEIELDSDLKIPFKAIWVAEIETGKSNYGYSVDSVFGLVGGAWNGKVKEICEMEETI